MLAIIEYIKKNGLDKAISEFNDDDLSEILGCYNQSNLTDEMKESLFLQTTNSIDML